MTQSLFDTIQFLHPKVLLFDLDGTIINSMPAHLLSWQMVLDAENVTVPEEFFLPFRGISSETIFHAINKSFNVRLDAKRLAEKKEQLFLDLLPDNYHLIDHVATIVRSPLITAIKVVASGGTRTNVVRSLELAKIDHYFQKVVTASDTILEKSNPDYFLSLAEDLQVSPKDCILLEDSPPCIEAAEKIGMRAFNVEHFQA